MTAASSAWRLGGMTATQLRIIILCGIIVMIDGFDVLALAFTASSIDKAMNLGPENLGVLFSAGLAGMLAGSVLLSPVADRIGRRWPVIIGLMIATIGMVMAAHSGNFHELLIARLVTGFAIGGIGPCLNAIVTEYASPRSRTYCISMVQAGFALGSTLGGFTAVALLAMGDWSWVFIAGAISTALLIPVTYFFLPESPAYLSRLPERAEELQALRAQMGELSDWEKEATGDASVMTVLHSHLAAFLLISGTFLIGAMGFYFISSWTPKILIDSGLSEGQGVSGGALLTAGGVFAALLIGQMSLRRSIIGLVSAIVLCAGLMTAIFGQLGNNLTVVLIGAFILGTLASATQIGINAVLAGLFPASVRATANGLSSGISRLGSIGSPLFIGYLIAHGWHRPELYALMALPYFVAAYLVYRLQRHYKY